MYKQWEVVYFRRNSSQRLLVGGWGAGRSEMFEHKTLQRWKLTYGPIVTAREEVHVSLETYFSVSSKIWSISAALKEPLLLALNYPLTETRPHSLFYYYSRLTNTFLFAAIIRL